MIYIYISIKGDVNGNGSYNNQDTTQAKNASLGNIVLSGGKLLAADLNGNGIVEESEAAIIKYAVLNCFTVRFLWNVGSDTVELE